MDLHHIVRFYSFVADGGKTYPAGFCISFEAGGADLQGWTDLLHRRVSLHLCFILQGLNFDFSVSWQM